MQLPSLHQFIKSLNDIPEQANPYSSLYPSPPCLYQEENLNQKPTMPAQKCIEQEGIVKILYEEFLEANPQLGERYRTQFKNLQHVMSKKMDKKEIYRSISFLMKENETCNECLVCSKTYKGKHNLRLHITRQHLGLKLYTCPDPNCDYATAYNDMGRHLACKHPHLVKQNKSSGSS
jgi:hypothetical protein